MDKLNMRTTDKVAAHIEQIGALFPYCIAEIKDADGKMKRAVDLICCGRNYRARSWMVRRNMINLHGRTSARAYRFAVRQESVIMRM